MVGGMGKAAAVVVLASLFVAMLFPSGVQCAEAFSADFGALGSATYTLADTETVSLTIDFDDDLASTDVVLTVPPVSDGLAMRFVSVATSNQGGDLTIGGTTAEVDAGCDRAVVSFTGITTAGPASSITVDLEIEIVSAGGAASSSQSGIALSAVVASPDECERSTVVVPLAWPVLELVGSVSSVSVSDGVASGNVVVWNGTVAHSATSNAAAIDVQVVPVVGADFTLSGGAVTPVATLAVGATVDVSFELTAGAGVSSTSLTGLTMDLNWLPSAGSPGSARQQVIAPIPAAHACTMDAQCTASGRTCVDGFCCATACDGECDTCAMAGAEGACKPRTAGTDPDDECTTYTCGGGFACGTQCADDTGCKDGFMCLSRSCVDFVNETSCPDTALAYTIGYGGKTHLEVGRTGVTAIMSGLHAGGSVRLESPVVLGAATGAASATPECNAAMRGGFHFVDGGSGEADGVLVCAKDADGRLGWKRLL